MNAQAWAVTPQGVVVTVRLTPKGGRDAIEGIDRLADGRPVLKVRVRATASEGEANEALIRLLAKSLDIPVKRVTLVAGATARIKRLALGGDGAALATALAEIAGKRSG